MILRAMKRAKALFAVFIFISCAFAQQNGTNKDSGTQNPAAEKQSGIALNPESSQTVAQPSGTTLGVTSLNNVFYVDGFPSQCTIGSASYGTQLDCAFYTAKAWTVAHHHSSQIVLGTNYYVTCRGLVEPTIAFYTVNIKGASQYSTYIDQYCSNPDHAVITKGEPENAGFSPLTITDLTIQALNNANSCMDLWGLDDTATIARVRCNSVIPGSDHMMQIGEGPGKFETGGATDIVVDTIGIAAPFNASNRQATVTAHVLNGAIKSYTVVDGGSDYDSAGAAYLRVFIRGFGHGDHPCTTMPTARAVLSGRSIRSVTPVTPGSGCVEPIDVQVYEDYPVKYGLEVNASDSSFRDVSPYVGSVAGIIVNGGNNEFHHAHPTNIAVGIIDKANDSYDDTECDTLGQYCIDFEGDQGSSVVGTGSYQGGHVLPGSSTYYFGPNAKYVQFAAQGNLCTGQKPADYHEFVTARGPVDAGAPLPEGVSVFGNDGHCAMSGSMTTQDVTTTETLRAAMLSGIAKGNSDLRGHIFLGAPPGEGTYVFKNTYASEPVCVGTDTTHANPVKLTVAGNTLHASGTLGDTVSYICVD
jgi:hypothetical protein